jgi:hydroxymethylpyrimidine pyrophosphatase-like HAD family hydrolase
MEGRAPNVPQSRPKLVVFDVDGTLTDGGHLVPDAVVEAVNRIRAAGVRVMLATGRRYRDTLPVAERLGIDGPLVTASGALVKQPGDHATLFRAAFGPGVLEGVLHLVAGRGHEAILYTDSFTAGYDFHCCSLTDVADEPEPFGGGLREYLGRNRGLANLRPDLHESPPSGVFAGFVMGGREAMDSLFESLVEAFPAALSLHTIRSPRYRDWMCEIAPVGVTKWSGVEPLARAWGIAADEICAVGDDVNDLPMIRAAGIGIAMGNARPEVRAAADLVVGTNDGTGIADVADLVLSRFA